MPRARARVRRQPRARVVQVPALLAHHRRARRRLRSLRAAHPSVSGLTVDTVLRVVTVPLHPGALRLYRERNIQQ